MIDNNIAAARASRAPILLPGTVYNYGPDGRRLASAPGYAQVRHPCRAGATARGSVRDDVRTIVLSFHEGGNTAFDEVWVCE